MSKFEVLCVTMHQSNFSKIKEMNLHSDVVFANQTDHTQYAERLYDGVHTARMISTQTKGVGINRNLSLNYAAGDICLFADDDVEYIDDMEQIVLEEFERLPKADIIIFNLDTDSETRKQKHYSKTKMWHRFEPMPWGAVRVAFRLSSVRKANLWFTTLFGGGTIFPSGEDSDWLNHAKKKCRIFLSDKTIGTVKMGESSWFSGYDEKFYYGKGAFLEHSHRAFFLLRSLYFAFRTARQSKLSFRQRMKWMRNGKKGYRNMIGFDRFKENDSWENMCS